MRHLEHVANPNSGCLHLVEASVALCGWVAPRLARKATPRVGQKCEACFDARRNEAMLVAPIRIDCEAIG